MPIIQFYEDEGDARLFLKSGVVITIGQGSGKLERKDISGILKRFGFKITSKWNQCEWGYEARIYEPPRIWFS